MIIFFLRFKNIVIIYNEVRRVEKYYTTTGSNLGKSDFIFFVLNTADQNLECLSILHLHVHRSYIMLYLLLFTS